MKGCLTGHILCLLFFVITTAGCDLNRASEPAVRTKTLDHVGVYTIKRQGDYLYAGTGEGLFRKHIDTLEDSLWEKMNLDRRIRDFAVLNKWEIIAGVEIPTLDSGQRSIFRTSDGGLTWQGYQNGFGGERRYGGLKLLERHPASPDILIARGYGSNLIRTSTGGRTWTVTFGWWDSAGISEFVKFDKHNPQNVWAGGMDAVFQPSLVKSTNGGKNWQGAGIPRIGGSTYDIAIDWNNSNRVLAAVRNLLFRTTSGGGVWNLIHTSDKYFFTLAQSVTNPDIFYASGAFIPSSDNRQLLFIEQSIDSGTSWETIILDRNLEKVHVYDLYSIIHDGNEMVLMATDHGMKRFYPD